MKRLLSGNEAVAHGAWEAGATVASGYPGTPSTEILETYAKFPGVYAEWAPNEKVALDTAIGAAYAGKRAFSTMKHVGLNVAADALYYAAMSGIEAGLMVVSADDPSMHSSQNEQDNRQLARFARIPCLDPADSQEAKDFAKAAFDLSEKFDTPVMLRMTTRICHTSAPVEVSEQRREPPSDIKFPRNKAKYVTIPVNARRHHATIEQRVLDLSSYAETCDFNHIEMRSKSLGIISSGVAYQYAREVFPDASVLKLGMVYPLPPKMIEVFASQVDRLIVLEELDPFVEHQVRLMGIRVYDGGLEEEPNAYKKSIFPICGELDPRVVRTSAEKAGLLKIRQKTDEVSAKMPNIELPSRPSVLCPGCPHRATYYVLHKLGVPVHGDIGCYTLGVAPPLDTTDTCGCMGASIGVAHGAAVTGDKERHVATIGDSTFFHTGIPALINVAYNRSNVITIILDNRVTGMTGHQDNPGTGKTLQQKETVRVEIEDLARVIGLKHVKTVPGYDVKSIEKTLKEWLKLDDPAVLIVREPCALLPSVRKRWMALKIVSEQCNGCGLCFRIGCPAILQSDEIDPKHNRPKAEIDPALCTGCEICAQICPRQAILFRRQLGEVTEVPDEVLEVIA
jgi:indolepyruvate ferredoxin oxidoreductase alpha subunit